MISSVLKGGLGNYMFQIATACTLSKKYNSTAVFDFSKSHKVHGTITSYIDNIFHNVECGEQLIKSIYNQPSFSYSDIPFSENMLLDGSFQSEKYLNRELILDLFSIDIKSKKYIYSKYEQLLNYDTVSMHIRRGDYIQKQDRHPVQSIEYYEKAMNYFKEYDKFIILSDDIAWCKDNFKGDNFIFIEGEKDYIDLYLMSMCNHNIIANSSFSWWGAWLNQNVDKRIIYPLHWFGEKKRYDTKDMIPEEWIGV